ncbi:MAG: hypothetical protein Q4G07_03690 [Oscillospiraceae bacterium]|nr:hypothetical protein [Oscillospiraceae bacterium]
MKKFLSALLCLVMASGIFAGCSSDGAALTINGEEVPNGIYLIYEMQALLEAQNIVTKQTNAEIEKELGEGSGLTATATAEETLESEVEGKPAKEWIHERTVALCRRYIYLKQQMAENGLSLTETQMGRIGQAVEDTWASYGDSYEANGISKDSYTQMMYASLWKTAVQDEFHTNGKLYTDETLRPELESLWGKITYVEIPLLNEEGTALSAEIQQSQRELADTILQEVKNGAALQESAQKYVLDAYRNAGYTEEELTAAEKYIKTEFTAIGRETDNQAFTDLIESLAVGETASIELESSVVVFTRVTTFDDEEEYNLFKVILIEADNGGERFENYIAEEAAKLPLEENAGAVEKYDPSQLKPLEKSSQTGLAG